MKLSGRILLLLLGLYLLSATALTPIFRLPVESALRLRSERPGMPHHAPAMQSALLLLDLDRRTHDEWQALAARITSAAALVAMLFCGVIAVNAAIQWLRFPVDSYSHVRHFGLTLSSVCVAVSLLLAQLTSHSVASNIRFLSLNAAGFAAAVSAVVILFIHKRLEPTT